MIIRDFIRDLLDPDLVFLRTSLMVGVSASIAFGMVGVLVVTRGVSAAAGAISHSLLGGIGAALYLQSVCQWTWLSPMAGALITGVLGAGLLTWLKFGGMRDDTAISCLWSVGMAVGLLFFQMTPKYVDPMSYLFGDILLVGVGDLWAVLVLDVVIVLLVLIFQNQIVICGFDEDEARLRGMAVRRIYFLLMCLVGMTVTLMVQVVGIVMVIALLTLPAVTAGLLTKKLWPMMGLACVVCAFSVCLGMVLGYEWPAGPMIILTTGALYGVVSIFRAVFA